MAAVLPHFYPQLRQSLKQICGDAQKRQGIASWYLGKLKEGLSAVPNLREEDLVSKEDLAVAFASFLPSLPEAGCSVFNQDIQRDARYLLCLLDPVKEELLPPQGSTDMQIWDTFSHAQLQQKQFYIAAVLIACLRGYTTEAGHGYHHTAYSLPEDNCLIVASKKKINGLVACFQQVQKHLEAQGVLTSELQSKLTSFATRLSSCCRALLQRMTTTHCKYPGLGTAIDIEADRWKWLSTEAAEIAAEVAKLPASADLEVISLGSWSMIPRSPRDWGTASVASMNSEMSCLSGQGGPHCFLPSYLFRSPQSAGAFTLISAQDLQKGTKILAADGAVIEVLKLEVQKTNKLVDLEIDEAVPFTTTPNHRIMVPSDATAKAIEVTVGSWVLCNNSTAKKVIGKREYIVEDQDVLAITFSPDKAVACFLPPEESVVLTKGLTPKPTRRGGKGRRANCEVMSAAGTEAEYED